MTGMETVVSLALGIALAAAVGLRIFVPLLVVSVAAWFGKVHLAASFAWLGTVPAMAMFGVAAAVEIAAYYVPGLDNMLDAIATPVALGAGTMMVAAPLWDMPPLFKWTAAIIAGGGAAGITHGVTSLLRAKSTVVTGGLGNPVVATTELGGALGLSLLALALPVIALLLVVVMILAILWMLRRLRGRTA
ncbi:MAG: DUF4126 domain-containing protein [Pseudomonadota bacterium]